MKITTTNILILLGSLMLLIQKCSSPFEPDVEEIADPENEIGEWHEPETHIIPLILDAASGRIDNLRVFGNDYPTPDGTCIRDYIHVSDIAEAHVLALDFMNRGGESQSFNLGNSRGYSIRELIATAESVTGKKVPFVIESAT